MSRASAAAPASLRTGRSGSERMSTVLRKKLDPGGPDETDDDRSDQRAFQAAEPADHHDDKGDDQGVDPHAQNRRLGGHHDRTAETCHEAADRKGQHIDQPDIEPERRGHAAIL